MFGDLKKSFWNIRCNMAASFVFCNDDSHFVWCFLFHDPLFFHKPYGFGAELRQRLKLYAIFHLPQVLSLLCSINSSSLVNFKLEFCDFFE